MNWLETLKLRLAKGEITEDQYKSAVALMQTDPQTNTNTQLVDKGAKIATIDSTTFYNKSLIYNNEEISYSQISSVRSSGTSSSFNFIPTEKSSFLHIKTKDENKISFIENSILLNRARHESIIKVGAWLKELTFQTRGSNLLKKISLQGRILLGESYSKIRGQVFLTKDGFIECETTRYSIKIARNKGFLALGTEWNSLNRASYTVNPSEISIAIDKGILGQPKSPITFTTLAEDVDIVKAIISQM